MFFRQKGIMVCLIMVFIWGGVEKRAEARDVDTHGNIQLGRVLNDIPAMKKYADLSGGVPVNRKVGKQDLIWQWAASRFIHPDDGTMFFWNEATPFYQANANIILPKGAASGYLLISPRNTQGENKGKARTFEELWHDLVRELLNAEIYSDYKEGVSQALTGEISKTEFMRWNVALQKQTQRQVLAFYEGVWQSWMKSRGMKPDPQVWKGSSQDSFEKTFEAFYEAYYEERIGPAVKRRKR